MLTDKQIEELHNITKELDTVVRLSDKKIFELYGEHKEQVKERLINELKIKGYVDATR